MLQNTNLQQSLPEQSELESPINLEKFPVESTPPNDSKNEAIETELNKPILEHREPEYLNEIEGKNEKDKLSKLDQIVQNLYSTHRVGNFMETLATPALPLIPSLGGKNLRIKSFNSLINREIR